MILIATAAPAAATSVREAGQLIFATSGATYANQTASKVNVGAVLGYLDDGVAPDGYLVGDVTLTVALPKSVVSTNAPSIVGSAWTLTSESNTSTDRVLEFTYQSGSLDATSSVTAALEFSVDKKSNAGLGAFTVAFAGDGTSNGVAVPQVTTTRTAAVQGVLVWNSAFSSGHNGGGYRVGFRFRHAGPYNPNPGRAVSSIVAIASFPATAAGAPMSVTGANWTFEEIGVSGGVRSVRFRYSGADLTPNGQTSTLNVTFPEGASPTASLAVTLNAMASSAGSTLTLAPVSLTVR
ncbi:hypothetical protein Lsed01_00658 [Demequina sediminis]|uniref:IPT/TIG domain-containing protein n=1 Tax=Demequina sediminis TaxID=1930058 RepID=A0ABP9WHY2_9MICO|nr:hypothetical protein [Demequina sediminis]BDZ62020.1 hypothetical protein GCM10025873_18110 [Demequina sediminis]